MDEFIHWPKPYLPLPETCDKILSWMIRIWMTVYFVIDSICNSVTLYPKVLQRMTSNVGLTFSVRDTTPRFIISMEQDN